ncbi:hypothetical protein JTB14_000832 [Gonioctena quinquepunctata]|nr:hypothetical protein JTB14_000832 [Gonioctena quinquepunctata]
MMQNNQELHLVNDKLSLELNNLSSDTEESKIPKTNMLTSIETLTQENNMLQDELKQLRLQHYTTLHDKSEETITRHAKINGKKNGSVSDNNPKNKKWKQLAPSLSLPTQAKSTKRILLVSNIHGKDLTIHMSNKTSSYTICSFVKHEASARELIRTAIELTRKFTSEDVVILWPNQVNHMIID